MTVRGSLSRNRRQKEHGLVADKKWRSQTRGLSGQFSLAWAYFTESWGCREDPSTGDVASLPTPDQPQSFEPSPAWPIRMRPLLRFGRALGNPYACAASQLQVPDQTGVPLPQKCACVGGGAQTPRGLDAKRALRPAPPSWLFPVGPARLRFFPPPRQPLFVVGGPRPQVRSGCSEVPQVSPVRSPLGILAKPLNRRREAPVSGGLVKSPEILTKSPQKY